jgi:hypothetical protein
LGKLERLVGSGSERVNLNVSNRLCADLEFVRRLTRPVFLR